MGRKNNAGFQPLLIRAVMKQLNNAITRGVFPAAELQPWAKSDNLFQVGNIIGHCIKNQGREAQIASVMRLIEQYPFVDVFMGMPSRLQLWQANTADYGVRVKVGAVLNPTESNGSLHRFNRPTVILDML